jgi:hypothetical protein
MAILNLSLKSQAELFCPSAPSFASVLGIKLKDWDGKSKFSDNWSWETRSLTQAGKVPNAYCDRGLE